LEERWQADAELAARAPYGRLSSFGSTAGWRSLLDRPTAVFEKLDRRVEWLRFARLVDLRPGVPMVWLGARHGGYAVPDGLISREWICYCAGLGTEISFELALAERYGCEVHAFDPTPASIAYVRQFADARPRLRFHPYGIWSCDTTKRFYAPRDVMHVSHSIANLQRTDSYFEAGCRSISSLCRELGHDHVDLLKLDIEGAEYEVLDSIFAADIRPRLLCVDFHRLNSMRAMANAFERVEGQGYEAVSLYRTDVTFLAAGSGRRGSTDRLDEPSGRRDRTRPRAP
jgi:FkbM family methyltransferase